METVVSHLDVESAAQTFASSGDATLPAGCRGIGVSCCIDPCVSKDNQIILSHNIGRNGLKESMRPLYDTAPFVLLLGGKRYVDTLGQNHEGCVHGIGGCYYRGPLLVGTKNINGCNSSVHMSNATNDSSD